MRYWFSLGRSRWFGARFHVHLSVIVVLALVALAGVESPVFAAVTLISFLGLILLHEFGHAAIAHHLGYAVNDIWLGAVHGRCEFQTPETRWEQCVIAWGGVAAQLAVAIPLIAFDAIWHRPLGIFGPVVLILGYFSGIVVLLNLLPVNSFDGQRAWEIIPLLRKRVEARRIVRGALGRNRGR